ncbi:helix-turn-helix domain-containing protein [Ruania halotolerans]|uniref:helix-turn-helix domain-containing protein n=1 Tax=Ruania halotolerans TaxID=2897773 RepID=UPI001E3C71A8|nr:helix-turn-helix domain-containing protein [Ruania halotolerans]UFU05491.1 helix-turn-helix domain-containing protein [Ruania halotolerans]
MLAHSATFEIRNGPRNEQILAAVHAGEKYDEIAARLGVSKSTVSRVARAAGVRKYAYAPRRRR